mgnify:CR=1 FL=1
MQTLNNEIKRSYLPKGTNVFYVGLDNEFMAKAREKARFSNDQQQPVGAILVCNGQVIDSDYNEGALSHPWLVKMHQKFCIRHFLGIPTGKYYWICPGCSDGKSHPEYKTCTRLLEKGIPGRPLDLYNWGHWAICPVCFLAMEKIKLDNLYLLKDCEKLFNPNHPENIIGRQFKLD